MSKEHYAIKSQYAPTILELAKNSPHAFEALAAMRLAILCAVRRGGLSQIEIRTARTACAPLHDIATLDLSADPIVEFNFGLQSAADFSDILDGMLQQRDCEILDELDRFVHLRRYAFWLRYAYPTLAYELSLALPPSAVTHDLMQVVSNEAMQPLIDALRMRTGLPSSSQLLDDDDLLRYAWAIQLRSAAAIEQVVSHYLSVPTKVLSKSADEDALRLRIGPLNWEGYTRLLPIGDKAGLQALVQLIWLITGPQLDVELILVLDRHELPGRHPRDTVGYPGWTLFPSRKGRHAESDPNVVISAMHCRQAAMQRTTCPNPNDAISVRTKSNHREVVS